MRSPSQLLLQVLVFLSVLTGPCGAQTSIPGTDIRSYLTADVSSRLSFAGTWIPIDTEAGLVGPFWNVIKLGTSQQDGVVLGGWAFNGSFASTLPDVTPVRAVLLEQQSNGSLLDATTRLLGNPVTNGAGSVIVADFNGDGFDDLVLTAHNESPFLFKHSTAYMSRSDGGLDKLILSDNVMDHDAKLVTLDGRKKILARSFGGSGNNGNGPGFNVIYSWNGSSFTVDTSIGDAGGMSVQAGPFTGNSDNWLIIGDSAGGIGIPWASTNPMLNYAYKYNGGVLSTVPVLLPKPYFNDKAAYSGFSSFWDPNSKSHTSRLWTTDLNQDGLLDILAGQEIWTAAAAGLQKQVYQMLINHGNMVFSDETDALAPEFNQDSYNDYSMRLADIDGSGIDTLLHSSNPAFSDSVDATKQGQYILVNDGTGRLYAAMHDEFRAMRTQIHDFLTNSLPMGSWHSSAITPMYIAYRTSSGKLNFVAVVKYFSPTEPNSKFAFVNVPLEIDLATDFRRDLTIPTRNGSKRIRTFAGNDVIKRTLSDPDCHIDGGLGTNTVIYPGKRADWSIARTNNGVTVQPTSSSGGTDTLVRVQRAQFDDLTVDLTTLPVADAIHSGWWWNANEGGRGYFIEVKNGRYYAASYLYDTLGNPVWYVTGPGSVSGGTLPGTLATYRGGQSLTGTYKAPAGPSSAGSMSIMFSDSTHGTITWPGGSVPITRYELGTGSLALPDPSFKPETGWWWNASEGGRGFSIEVQGDNLFIAGFMYDGGGNPVWYVSAGKMTTPTLYQGTWAQYQNGQAMGGPARTASVKNANVGGVSISFSSTTTATLLLPDGRTLPLTRYPF